MRMRAHVLLLRAIVTVRSLQGDAPPVRDKMVHCAGQHSPGTAYFDGNAAARRDAERTEGGDGGAVRFSDGEHSSGGAEEGGGADAV